MAGRLGLWIDLVSLMESSKELLTLRDVLKAGPMEMTRQWEGDLAASWALRLLWVLHLVDWMAPLRRMDLLRASRMAG